MKSTANYTSNYLTKSVSTLNRIGFTLTLAAASFCGLSSQAIAQEPATLQEAMRQHPDWVQIPGELIRPDCVHAIPKGAKVGIDSDGEITGDVMVNNELFAHFDACPEKAIATRPLAGVQGLAKVPGVGNGWVEADQADLSLGSSDDIDYLAGNWTVPNYPKLDGATIFLFNGIEPATEKWIIQPVLQFGPSAAGGGNYFAIASWLVSSSQAYFSPLETVNPGDQLFGGTQLVEISGKTKYFDVLAQDNSSGAYSGFEVYVTNQHWTWAFRGVLEAYNVSSCSNFPNSPRTVFSGSQVAHGFPSYNELSPNWKGGAYGFGGPSCFYAVVAASGTLDY